MNKKPSIAGRLGALTLGLLVLSVGTLQPASAQFARGQAREKTNADADKSNAPQRDPKALALLDAAKAKLRGLQSLVVDAEVLGPPTSDLYPTKRFDRNRVISVQRPASFRVERVTGAVTEDLDPLGVSDGQTINTYFIDSHIAYEKPLRKENFYFEQGFLVQFFFSPHDIRFDPRDGAWGRPVSQFDANLSAYDKDTRIAYIGERTLEGRHYEVVEIKYNTQGNDVRQQIYVGDDKLIYQVDSYLDGVGIDIIERGVYSQKFRNYRLNKALGAETWSKKDYSKSPVQKTDPVRLGAQAPEFTLPGTDGKEYTMTQMLQGKKGLFVCTLDALKPAMEHNPDTHLEQMRWLQEFKNRYEKQGLAIVAIAGSPAITPDLKDEVILNRLPDLRRFNYPVLIDIDLERGIQGTAYQNFHLDGRNNILLDAKGRVVYAAKDFKDRTNLLGLYQSLQQIGFKVSPAEMESATEEGKFKTGVDYDSLD